MPSKCVQKPEPYVQAMLRDLEAALAFAEDGAFCQAMELALSASYKLMRICAARRKP